jgi:Tfp pilus assembly protein PilX
MTLLVGLILLVMLTVIGLVGFRNVTMTERMSGNSADRNVSFQSSESAGKEALEMIETAFTSGVFTNLTAGATGYFATPFAKGAETAFWSGGEDPPYPSTATIPPCPYLPSTTTFNWKCSTSVGTKYARNFQPSQYAVEMFSAFDDTGTVISLPVTPVTTTNFKYVFRVTTRSTGGSGGAEVVLQTIYTHLNP